MCPVTISFPPVKSTLFINVSRIRSVLGKGYAEPLGELKLETRQTKVKLLFSFCLLLGSENHVLASQLTSLTATCWKHILIAR